LTAVLNCRDRENTGFEFALRGCAKGAERALEGSQFSTMGSGGSTAVVRSDNGLIFQS